MLCGAPGVPPASLVILGAGVLGPRGGAGRARHRRARALLDRQRRAPALRHASTSAGRCPRCWPRGRTSRRRCRSPTWCWGPWRCTASARRSWSRARCCKLMKPRSVVMDLSIDMGGCFETSRPDLFPSPTYEVDGILHFCVPNLPSVAARSATLALTNALLPYLLEIVAQGIDAALARVPRPVPRRVPVPRRAAASESLARVFGVRPGAAVRGRVRRAPCTGSSSTAPGHHGRGGRRSRSRRATTSGSTAAATTPRS